MKISDLIASMSKYSPDTEVLVEVGDQMCPITRLDYDCFHPAGPWVFLIDTTQEKVTVDAVSEWLDGVGELPRTPTDRMRQAHVNLHLVVDTDGKQAAA